MPHFSDNDVTDFDSQLRRQRDVLLTAIRQRLHQCGNTDEMALKNYFSDVREQAGASLLADTDIALLQLELAELDEIDQALARVHAGSYGRCACCATRISLKRLRAQPAARMCLLCQETVEKHRLPPHAHG